MTERQKLGMVACKDDLCRHGRTPPYSVWCDYESLEKWREDCPGGCKGTGQVRNSLTVRALVEAAGKQVLS